MPDETPTGDAPRTEPLAGLSPSMNDVPPVAFGRYRILDRLGEGGMGSVYFADHDRRFAGDLSTICGKVLPKEPVRRYDTAAALADDVRRYLRDEPIVARPTTSIYVLRKFVRRNRSLVVAASLVAVALLTGLGLAIDGRRRANTAAQSAFAEAENAKREQARADDATARTKVLLAEQTFARAEADRRSGKYRDAVDEYQTALDGGYPQTTAAKLAMAECHNFLLESASAM